MISFLELEKKRQNQQIYIWIFPHRCFQIAMWMLLNICFIGLLLQRWTVKHTVSKYATHAQSFCFPEPMGDSATWSQEPFWMNPRWTFEFFSTHWSVDSGYLGSHCQLIRAVMQDDPIVIPAVKPNETSESYNPGPLKTTTPWIVVVQSLSCIWLFVTPWTAAGQDSLSFIISRSLLKLTSVESVMPSSHLVLCRPLLPLPSIFIRVFSTESALCIRCQSIGVSALSSVLPMSIQDWFPSGFTGLISLLPKGLSRVLSNTTVQNHQFFSIQLSL